MSKPIPIPGKPRHRFHESIVFLVALDASCTSNQPAKAYDLSSDAIQSAQKLLPCFINKLGHICDSRPYGDTVTAFVVLKLETHVEYRFASNQRDSDELREAEAHVREILDMLGAADTTQLGDEARAKELRSRILHRIITFNALRVKVYLSALRSQVAACVKKCLANAGEDSDTAVLVLEKLLELQSLSEFSQTGNPGDASYAESCETLMAAIQNVRDSPVDEAMRIYTNEGKMNQSECWHALRHATGRLLSYYKAVAIFISARKEWPELFTDFQVISIPSSSPALQTLQNRYGPQGLCAHDMIGRMLSDVKERAEYRRYAEQLQPMELDATMRQIALAHKPIVHAEALVLQSLVEGGNVLPPSKFFNNYKYIGCSKPSCRLCAFYFLVHPSGVQVRPSHGSLYPQWRMPDVHDEKAAEERGSVMMKVRDLIRDEACRLLREKVSGSSRFDSNTEPTYLTFMNGDTGSSTPEDLRTPLGGLQLHSPGDGEISGGSSDSRSSNRSSPLAERANGDQDDEDGGVGLC